MGPRLHFLGTGTSDARGVLSEGGFLILTDQSVVAVDPGPGAAQGLAALKHKEVDEVIATNHELAHDADLIKVKTAGNKLDAKRLAKGWVFKLGDGVVSYVAEPLDVREVGAYQGDVLIVSMQRNVEKIIEKLKPKLVVLTRFDKESVQKNPVYLARDLQKKTGVQTIAAQDGLLVDLYSYGALAEQKSLKKFTEGT